MFLPTDKDTMDKVVAMSMLLVCCAFSDGVKLSDLGPADLLAYGASDG